MADRDALDFLSTRTADVVRYSATFEGSSSEGKKGRGEQKIKITNAQLTMRAARHGFQWNGLAIASSIACSSCSGFLKRLVQILRPVGVNAGPSYGSKALTATDVKPTE
jgi:hypothetical protein